MGQCANIGTVNGYHGEVMVSDADPSHYSVAEEWFGETAWPEGSRFSGGGGWAMYVEYAPNLSVMLLAGRTKDAGR